MKRKVMLLILFLIFTGLPSSEVHGEIIKQTTSSNGITTYHVSTHEENFLVFSLIKARRETEAKIIYSSEMADFQGDYLQEAIKYNYIPQNMVLNVSYGIGSYYSISMSKKNNIDGTVSANYYISYLENTDQTEYVYNKIRFAIQENASNLKTDYQKAYWAYHWIIDHVHYDKTYSKFSAYDGLQESGTVCKGYALLYCALANELGLDCSFVSGTVGLNDKINHAWNIIKLNGEWYCVDSTWGDNDNKDKYFLKSKDTFLSSDYDYRNSDLYSYYIDAGENFAVADFDNTKSSESHFMSPSVYNIKMDVLKYNTLEVGEGYRFMISNIDETPIHFKSADSAVAKVDSNGIIIGASEGTTIITAYNTDLNIKQSCEITVIPNNDVSPTLTETELTLEVGDLVDVDVVNKVVGSKYKWTSSDKTIAKVTSTSGKITSLKSGTCVVTCTITFTDKQIVVLKVNVSVE
ncbi:MAG: transglutaminase domain-containing protein [Candidatus Saccharimonadaceae bacterium]|nr:transglutaminase domain-containing protein [Candidatus Saccharimonadaceae bacterium]